MIIYEKFLAQRNFHTKNPLGQKKDGEYTPYRFKEAKSGEQKKNV